MVGRSRECPTTHLASPTTRAYLGHLLKDDTVGDVCNGHPEKPSNDKDNRDVCGKGRRRAQLERRL